MQGHPSSLQRELFSCGVWGITASGILVPDQGSNPGPLLSSNLHVLFSVDFSYHFYFLFFWNTSLFLSFDSYMEFLIFILYF